MKTRKLITIKPHKYGTRHLTAGDEYEVPAKHAIALVASKKARFADKAVRAAKVDQQLVPESDDSIAGVATSEASLDSLRMEATQIGIDVDRRWGMARLQYEIGRAKG